MLEDTFPETQPAGEVGEISCATTFSLLGETREFDEEGNEVGASIYPVRQKIAGSVLYRVLKFRHMYILKTPNPVTRSDIPDNELLHNCMYFYPLHTAHYNNAYYAHLAHIIDSSYSMPQEVLYTEAYPGGNRNYEIQYRWFLTMQETMQFIYDAHPDSL